MHLRQGIVELIRRGIAAAHPEIALNRNPVAEGFWFRAGGRTVHVMVDGDHVQLFETSVWRTPTAAAYYDLLADANVIENVAAAASELYLAANNEHQRADNRGGHGRAGAA